jgi:parallel beta-helix repeat protein
VPTPSPVGERDRRPQHARGRVAEVLAVGTILNGRYRVERVLGSGSFGRVYLTEDVNEPGSLVAVKELLAMEFPTAEEQRDAMVWFKREVSALLTLDHPGIPGMQGYWTAQRNTSPLYLAMDYIPGKTLAELQIEQGGRIPRAQALTWGVALCGVLEYLHAHTPSIIFRDLKPSNVLIDSRSHRPVLIDFGLARQMTPVAATAVGTWGYVPFEQVLGRPEPRSDLYALGALLHGLISGIQPDAEYRRLMRGGADVEACLRSLFPPLDELVPGTPSALTEVIRRATAFAPEDRFPNAQAMALALQAALDNPGGLVMRGPVAASAAQPPAVDPVPLQARTTPEQNVPSYEEESTRHVTPLQRAGAAANGLSKSAPAPPAAVAREVGAGSAEVMGRAAAPRPAAPILSMEAAALLETVESSAGPEPEPRPVSSEDSARISRRTADPVDNDISRPEVDDRPRSSGGLTGGSVGASSGRLEGAGGSGSSGRRSLVGPGRSGEVVAAPVVRSIPGSIRVSPNGVGALRSIAEAIYVAKAGARIEVEPGVYSEPLVVDKLVEIVGIGPIAEVVIDVVGGTALLVQAEHARISNLTVRGRGVEGGPRYHVVNIPAGRVVLEDCHIVSQGLACVNIHGAGTKPTLRRLFLRNAQDRALVVYDRSAARIEDCDIQSGTYPVRVSSGAVPLFTRCLIHSGRFGGVWVAEQGRGTFDDCDIVDNGHHGVVVRQAGYITLTNCRVQRNGWNAISVADTSGARVKYCDLRGNRRSAWEIRDSARGQVDQSDNIEV